MAWTAGLAFFFFPARGLAAGDAASAECASSGELRRSFPEGFFLCPNCSVLLIDLDGLRADRLGSASRGTSLTPFLDSLSERGISFPNAAAQSNWTFASAASVVTSQYPSVHLTLATDNVLNPGIPTVFSAFAARGYRIFGHDKRPFIPSAPMSMDHEQFSFDNPAYASEVAAELDWISTSTTPGMAYILSMDMHWPYWRSGPVPEGVDPELRLGFHAGLSTAAVRAINRAYDDRVSVVDARLRDLFARIDGAGLRDRTIVFLFANHGEALLEHGYWGHGYGYQDEETRVPLIILHPKVNRSNAARVCPQVELIDIAPTALEMTGKAASRFGAGRSLVPLIQGLVGDHAFEYAFSEGSNMSSTRSTMARSREWKLIATLDDSYALYDLARDPAETRDVKSAETKAFKKMKRVLKDWRNSLGEPYRPIIYPQSEAEKAMLIKNGYW